MFYTKLQSNVIYSQKNLIDIIEIPFLNIHIKLGKFHF